MSRGYDIEHKGHLDVYKVTRRSNPTGKIIAVIVGLLCLIGLANSDKSEKPNAAPASYTAR